MPRSAAALGAVTGLRTFGAWAGLAIRGRIPDSRLRVGLLVAAAGEMVADKTTWIPPRCDPPSLAGRVISGALAGRLVGGPAGARAGAATAAASTYASERARELLGQRLGLPDPVLAVAEDALVLGVATTAPGLSDQTEASANDEESDGRSVAREALRGLAAGAIGTAAMTSVQMAYLRATGGQPSTAPGDVGRKLVDVPRGRRAAFNQAMHMLCGTSWGAPFALLRRSQHGNGLLFGVAVWGVSLVELPLLDVAEPPWRQPAGALALDLAFHLVYGTATAAVLQV
jgi:uncharacterized membrane protein